MGFSYACTSTYQLALKLPQFIWVDNQLPWRSMRLVRLAEQLSKLKFRRKLVKVGEPNTTPMALAHRPGGREPMSETGLVMVIFMVLTVMIVMSYSRQILLFMVAVAISLFCLGVYCLAMSLHG